MRDVNALAQRDLLRSWRQFDLSDAAGVRDGLMDTLPKIAGGYHLASSTVAADWYDIMRHDAQVKKKFSAVMPPGPKQSRIEALSRWGVGPLFAADPRPDIALSKISGGLQRIVNDGARQTIVDSSLADPSRVGWERVTSGGCDFCEMLASRGAVYGAESANFDSHDHCQCDAVPEFDEATARILPTSDSVRDALDRFQQEASSTTEALPVPASNFTADELRNALDPSRQRTASAITKELEATAAGKDLTAAIKSFTETRGGVANLRKNIEKTIDGTAGEAAKAKAQAFLDAMNTYPTEDVPTLHRGFAVKVEQNTNEWWDAFEGQFQPGQKFSLNASSFSSSEKKAAEFSRMIGGTKKATSNHTAVRMVLEGDVHALPVEQLSKFKSEKEWITGGEFEVVGYEPASTKNPYYKVTIRQVKKLEAKP
jgi:hypothetical protein